MKSPPRPRGRRRRLNWTLRWGGVVVCVIVAGAWVVSLRWAIGRYWGFTTITDLPLCNLSLSYGCIWWNQWSPLPIDTQAAGLWSLHDIPVANVRWRPSWSRQQMRTVLCLPLWLPFLLIVAPTVLAWRSELRRRRGERIGYCTKCGYDLAGLAVNAACPECGRGREATGA